MAGEDQRVRCVACDGRGWNEHEHTMVRYAEFRVIGQTCPICRGSGLVSLEHPPILDVAKWAGDRMRIANLVLMDEAIRNGMDRSNEPPGTGEQMPKTRREWLGTIADLCAAEVWDDDHHHGCGCPGLTLAVLGGDGYSGKSHRLVRAFGGWLYEQPVNHHRAMLAAIDLWAAEPDEGEA